MADRKISELPPFPHHQVSQNSDVFYIVASGLASETRDATNYRVSFTGLSRDILADLGGGLPVISARRSRIGIGGVEPADTRDLELENNSYVLGDLYGENDLYLQGTAFFDQSIFAKDDITASGDLYVTGSSVIKNDATIGGNLSVEGGIYLNEISTQGDISTAGNISAKNAGFTDLYVYGDAFVKDDTTLTGSLLTWGSATFNGFDVTFNTTLCNFFNSLNTFYGAVHVNADADFTQDLSITGDINVSGRSDFQDLYIHGDAFVKQNATISGDLTILGTTTTIDTERLVIEDNNIELGSHPSPNDLTAAGGGITLVASTDGLTDKKIYWNLNKDAWTFNTNIDIEGSGSFSDGIHLATDQLIGGIKVGLEGDTTNYGGLEIDNGYLKVSNWTSNGAESEAGFFVSDIKLKDDRKNIDSPIEILNQINGVYFTWNESAHASLTGKKDVGVIAQEVQAVLPEIVAENTVGNLAVSYHKMIPVLIESIKELSEENKLLKSRIDRLESKQ